MPRALGLRDDDILGRLADLERRVDDGETSRMTKAERAERDEFERQRLVEEYPVQMVAPGVFPDTAEKVPASETEAVIDSIRAKTEGELRHDAPFRPMDAPPTDELAADARARAVDDFAAERKLLDGAKDVERGVDASSDVAKIEGAQRGDQPAADIAEISRKVAAPAGKMDSDGSPPATGGARAKSDSKASDEKAKSKAKE